MILEILTRHITSRELSDNLHSVAELARKFKDEIVIEHTVLVDHYRRGPGRSHVEILRQYKPRGDYILILDDDDSITDFASWAELIEILKSAPPAVSVAMWHRANMMHDEGPLPRNSTDTSHGSRGISSVICSKVVYDIAKLQFFDSYDGDWPFVAAVLRILGIVHTSLILTKEGNR